MGSNADTGPRTGRSKPARVPMEGNGRPEGWGKRPQKLGNSAKPHWQPQKKPRPLLFRVSLNIIETVF